MKKEISECFSNNKSNCYFSNNLKKLSNGIVLESPFLLSEERDLRGQQMEGQIWYQ